MKLSNWRRFVNFLILVAGIGNLLIGLFALWFPNFCAKNFGIEFCYFCNSNLLTLGAIEIVYGWLLLRYKLNHWGIYLLFLLVNINAIIKMVSAVFYLTNPVYITLCLFQLIIIAAFLSINIAYNKNTSL